MDQNFLIRPVTPEDIPVIHSIYAPYVLESAANFEYEVPSVEEIADRVAKITAQYPWLIAECDGEIAGYAYASRFRPRAAYEWSAESTIYVSPKYHGSGIARRLYRSLFDLLALQGYGNVFAGVTVSNDRSEQFHRSMGFEEIGIFRNVGFKHGKWQHVKWFQLALAGDDFSPIRPRPIDEVLASREGQDIVYRD